MSDQPELQLNATPPADKNVLWLEKLLLGARCWMTAKDIILTVNGAVLDRDVRELASASPRIISGQKGYKHVENSTPEEIKHCSNWLISQGKKMIKRGIGIRQHAHEVVG